MDPWGIDDLTALLARMNGGYPSAAFLVLAFGAAFLGFEGAFFGRAQLLFRGNGSRGRRAELHQSDQEKRH